MKNRDENNLTIGEAAAYLDVSIDTLRRWDKAGLLPAQRTASNYRYYKKADLEERLLAMDDLVALAKSWAMSHTPIDLPGSYYCGTHDIFEARSARLKLDLERAGFDGDLVALVDAVVGEIGNNSFDHNIGNWPDVPGVFFGYNLKKSEIVLADRGQGILTTLRRVQVNLSIDQEALAVAFTLPVSGRGAEKRGNGLKFVRAIVAKEPLSLNFGSGNASLELKQGNNEIKIKTSSLSFHGCIAIIKILA